MTDGQSKVLANLKKRKTPATLKQVQLQMKTDKRSCDRNLRNLTIKGYLKTKVIVNVLGKERVYEFVTDKVEEKPVVKEKPKFHKGRVTVEPKFYNNPFNIGQ